MSRGRGFLNHLKSVNGQRSTAGQRESEHQVGSDATELTDLFAPLPPGGESRLSEELEQACIATGASGAAIALVREEKIVCLASTGPSAPDIGVCLDPHHGLSGSCVQTRQLQRCNDTQTDPRVDAEACQQLGVRSIIVLPLMDGDELFGIVEILSSHPNAFEQRDLDILKALTDRIVESRRRNWVTAAAVPHNEPLSRLQESEEHVPPNQSLSAELDSTLSPRKRPFRRYDIWTPILGMLVIGVAVLLGILIGWQFGWKAATKPPSRLAPLQAKAPSTHEEPQPGSASMAECGQPAGAGPTTEVPLGGLTVCQEGQVIFRLPPPAPSPTRPSHRPQRSLGIEGKPASR